MELNAHQRLFLSGVLGGSDMHLATVGALLRLAGEEGQPPLEPAAQPRLVQAAALLDQLREGLEALLAGWELDDRRIRHLPVLVQVQRVRTGLHATRALQPGELAVEERTLARELATLALDARALEEAVLNGHWGAHTPGLSRRGGEAGTPG